MEELSPEQVAQIRTRKRANVETSEDRKEEFISGSVRVDYESLGRFDTPESLTFKDYSTMDINAIVMSSQDELIETLVPILNGMICGEYAGKFNCANMTIEEFVETLIAIKGKYVSIQHKHPYMCECQYELPEADQKMQEGIINLSELKFKSIDQVEEELKKTVKEDLDLCTEEEWIVYRNSYAAKNNISEDQVTKEYVVNSIKIKEPFYINSDGHEIGLRLMRIADVIKAQKMINKEYNSKIKMIQNRVEHGVPAETLKMKKQKELEDIQKEKAKKVLLYIKAFSIVSIDGKELSDNEKIEAMMDRDLFPRHITQDIDSLLDQLKHGVYDTKEFTCPICGKLNKEDLQHNFSVTELLPLNSKDQRDGRFSTRLNIRFGA